MMGIRGSLLILVGAALGCSSQKPAADYVRNFQARAPRVVCQPVHPFRETVDVVDLSPAGDSAILVVDPTARRVHLLDGALRERWSFTMDVHGPRGVLTPNSAALVGDTLVYVADRDARLLKRFTPAGEERGIVRLPFGPDKVREVGGALVVSSFIIGSRPGHLLYRIRNGAAEPLDVAPAPFADMSIKALGNMMSLAARPGGGWVAAHAFLVPFGFIAWPGRAPRKVAVPVPDATKRFVEHTPAPPITDENIPHVAVAAMTLAAEPETGDLIYLTRTGRQIGGRNEKALIRADSAFHFRSAERLNVYAVDFARIPGGRGALTVNGDLDWHVCPLPR